MNKFKFIILALAFAMTGCTDDPVVPASFVTIRGVVFEQNSETPLFDTRVTILNTSDFVDTDSTGAFVFDSLLFRENFSLRAERAGFRDQTISVAFNIGGNAEREVEIPMDLDLTGNTPPTVPTLIHPPNGAIEVGLDTVLRWRSIDSDSDDDLSFEVFLSDNTVGGSQIFTTTDTFLQVHDLKFNQVYTWQVVASDGVNEPVNSLFGTFQTESSPEDLRVHFARRDVNTGNYVIFAAERPGEDFDPDSLRTFPLTDPGQSCWRPHFSPEANRVAYISIDGINYQLYTMDRNGDNPRQVTFTKPLSSFEPEEINYAWSPNGSQLLYPHNDKLFLINENGSGLTEFATAEPGYFFVEVDWSDQNVIAARMQRPNRYDSRIVIYNINGTVVGSNPLVDDSFIYKWHAGPVLSESGNFIVYARDRDTSQYADGLPRLSELVTKPVLADLEDPATPIEDDNDIPPNTSDLYPCIPPGGETVMFVNRPSDNSYIGDIWVMEISQGNNVSRRLVYPNATMPDWQ